jgi:hypothetical protein
MRYHHVGQGQSGNETQRRREELLYPGEIEVEGEGEKAEESEGGNNGEIQRNSDPTRREHLATQLKVLPRVPAYEPYRESSERRKEHPSDETHESLQGFRAVIPSLLERDQKRYRQERGDDVRDGLKVRGDAREEVLRYEVPHINLSFVSMQADRQKDGAYPERGADQGGGRCGGMSLSLRKVERRDKKE